MLNREANIEQLWNLAVKCHRESDFATAIQYYRRISELQPQRTDIYCELGKIFQQQQQTASAIEAYRRAIEINPNQLPWVYDHLAKALKQQGSAAIPTYQEAVRRYGYTPSWICRDLADLYTQQQQYELAIATYRELIDLAPAVASSTLVKIGDIYTQQNKFFAAQAAYRQARQARALYNVKELVNSLPQFLTNSTSKVDILDNGCDPTGRQLALLAEYTTGRVVGTNIFRGFPQHTVKQSRFNNEFYYMDGQNLSFDDCSFDLVISLNVLEHVLNPAKYLQECYRVLRTGGYGFFSWYPLWSGATGHHVHPDMVSNKARELGLKPPVYSLDGVSIPFWGHLLFSAIEMLDLLCDRQRYDPSLAKWMQHYIYYGKDLNRWFWRDVWRSFQTLHWNAIEVCHRGVKSIDASTLTKLQHKYGFTDGFQISGAKIVVQK